MTLGEDKTKHSDLRTTGLEFQLLSHSTFTKLQGYLSITTRGSRGAGLHLHWKDKHELEVCFKFELAMIRSLDSSRGNKDKLLYQNQTVCNPQVAPPPRVNCLFSAPI